MKTVHVYIKGKVQGVWFRSHTKQQAEILGIHGWVRNVRDGRVEGVFEGEDDTVDKMVEWCHHGSPLSTVKEVKIEEMNTPVGCPDFKIKH